MKYLSLCSFLLLAAGLPAGEAAPAQAVRVEWEFPDGRAVGGSIVQVAVDPDTGRSFVATTMELQEFKRGKFEIVRLEPEKRGRLLLAPGGKIVARLSPEPRTPGLLGAELFDVDGKKKADLRPSGPPYGILGIQFGRGGSSILTATPLDNPEGAHGRFQYTFWNPGGDEIKRVVFPDLPIVVPERAGPGVLFLGSDRAEAHAAGTAKPLWSLRGAFRAAALADGGRLALLAPPRGQEPGVEVFRSTGESWKVARSFPIRAIRISPDLARGLIFADDGRFMILDLGSRQLSEAISLGLGEPCRIYDADFLPEGLLAFALRRGADPKASRTWKEASIVIADLQGRVVWRRDFEPTDAGGGYPRLEIPPGSRKVAGYTVSQAVLATVER